MGLVARVKDVRWSCERKGLAGGDEVVGYGGVEVVMVEDDLSLDLVDLGGGFACF